MSGGAAAATAAARSFLAFDYGEKRVGAAYATTLSAQARPLKTLAAQGDARFAAVAALIAEWQPEALVVGVPFHPDGAPHQNTERARRFARRLQGRFGLPVAEEDERWTTTEALASGARDADAAAACLILEQHLRRLADIAAAASNTDPDPASTPE
jgi:putative Holliday junction resolvase